MSGWVDTHCHIQDEKDPLLIAREARAAGVEVLICIGTDVDTSFSAVDVANAISGLRRDGDESLPHAYATIGLHPHDASNRNMAGVEGISSLVERYSGIQDAAVVGIGECGLDYFYENSSREDQRRAFRFQIELAKTHGLTLVVHTRDAWEDTFAILSEVGPPAKLVFHCFTGGPPEAEKALEMGAFLSFSGMVTFKNAEMIRQAALITPADRLVIETDSPFLAPVPHRGKANVPAYVSITGEFLADLRSTSICEFSHATTAAARECFSINL